MYGSCFIFVHIFHVENASSLRETSYRKGVLISKSVACSTNAPLILLLMFGPCLGNEYPVNFKSSVVYLNGTWRDLQRGKRIFELATVRFIRLYSN